MESKGIIPDGFTVGADGWVVCETCGEKLLTHPVADCTPSTDARP